MKVTEYFSNFHSIKHCSECSWFAPTVISLASVCPECGGKIQYDVGRYRMREERGWFRMKEEVVSVEWRKG